MLLETPKLKTFKSLIKECKLLTETVVFCQSKVSAEAETHLH